MSEPLLKQVGDSPDLDLIFPKPKEKYNKVFRSYWSSPEKLAREIKTLDRNKAWNDAGWNTDDPNWRGSKSMEEAIQLAEEGWEEGKERCSRLQNRIRARNPIMLKRKQFSIVGASPDVPRAISGNPLNMRVPDVSKASRRVVITLLSDMAASCGHAGNEFINRAAVLAAVIDEIEAAGYACDVISYCNSEGGGWFSNGDEGFNYCGTVQVKNSNQPVDISRLSFGLGHTSLFRRLIFAEKGHDHFCRDVGSGLGHSDDLDLTGLNEKSIYQLPSIRSAGGAFRSEQTAETEGVQFIIKALKDQGFPLFEVDAFARKVA